MEVILTIKDKNILKRKASRDLPNRNTKTENHSAIDMKMSHSSGLYSERMKVGYMDWSGTEILEKGHITFFYRPKVELKEAHHLKDVGKFVMQLEPTQSTAGKHRLIIIGNKQLPSINQILKKPVYCIVEAVSDFPEDFTGRLEGIEYDTKTLGKRHVEGMRVAAKGLYEIIKMPDNRIHFVYVILVPDRDKFGSAQEEFNILPSEEFTILVRNPHQLHGRRSTRLGLADQGKGAAIPSSVVEKYCHGKREDTSLRWCPGNPEMLNYERSEILLVAVHDKIEQGIDNIAEIVQEDAAHDKLDGLELDLDHTVTAELH